MNETLTKIQAFTVGSGGASSVVLANIPQTYTDLKLVCSVRTNRASYAADSLFVQLNGVSTGYSNKMLYSETGGVASVGTSNPLELYTSANTNNTTANVFGNTEYYIPNYTSSNAKTISSDGTSENMSTSYDVGIGAHSWSNTAPITSITISPGYSSSFLQYSEFTLYGIRNSSVTYGNSIKATGGIVSTDGTYIYHTFLSSASFVPSTKMLADVLVIAGGGSGGGSSSGYNAGGGGGGAGGLLYFPNTQLTSGTTYTCSVGSGASRLGNATGSAGSAGTNSYFGALTPALGGGAGAAGGSGSNTGGAGGSGGGGNNSGGGGAGTVNQGNTGGAGSTNGGTSTGGGGGGSAAAGSGASSSGGSGGAGTSAYSTFGFATGTGVNIGGAIYYAGGGGGGGYGAYGGFGGNGGGGQGGAQHPGALTAQNGLTNTGSGGGGEGEYQQGAGAGGSGLIIVRYKA